MCHMGTNTDRLMLARIRRIDIERCIEHNIHYIYVAYPYDTSIDISNDNNSDKIYVSKYIYMCIYIYICMHTHSLYILQSRNMAQPLTLDASWKVHLSPVWYFCASTSDLVYQLWAVVFIDI